MKQNKEHAVSPVVGVMLMLVVTIIIAAVVSGFAGGLMKGQTKAPQATIQGKFSVTSGLQIIHAGGDSIPTSNMIISTSCGPTFGPGLEAMSKWPINLWNVTNSSGTPVVYSTNPYKTTNAPVDGYNITSFNPGDTLYVNLTNCDPRSFQRTVYSSHGNYFLGSNSTWVFVDSSSVPISSSSDAFWALNFVNPANIGKSFYLDVSDKNSGALISRAVVTISG